MVFWIERDKWNVFWEAIFYALILFLTYLVCNILSRQIYSESKQLHSVYGFLFVSPRKLQKALLKAWGFYSSRNRSSGSPKFMWLPVFLF